MQIDDALERFLVQLEADGRSQHTIRQYRRHVRLLGRWCADVGHTGAIGAVSRISSFCTVLRRIPSDETQSFARALFASALKNWKVFGEMVAFLKKKTTWGPAHPPPASRRPS